MEFKGFHHIGLIVKDLEKSLQFYVEGLGGKTVFSFPMGDTGKIIYLVDMGGNAVIELIPNGNGENETNAHWAHIALLTENPHAAYEAAIKAGAVSRSEPKNMMLGTMNATNAFVYGPDGEVIEFFQVI